MRINGISFLPTTKVNYNYKQTNCCTPQFLYHVLATVFILKNMACEICGSNSCIAPYHSIEEQQNFYEVADRIKKCAKEHITSKIDRLNGHYHGDNYYVKLDDVLKIIEDSY